MTVVAKVIVRFAVGAPVEIPVLDRAQDPVLVLTATGWSNPVNPKVYYTSSSQTVSEVELLPLHADFNASEFVVTVKEAAANGGRDLSSTFQIPVSTEKDATHKVGVFDLSGWTLHVQVKKKLSA